MKVYILHIDYIKSDEIGEVYDTYAQAYEAKKRIIKDTWEEEAYEVYVEILERSVITQK